jgi:hypothetical protein
VTNKAMQLKARIRNQATKGMDIIAFFFYMTNRQCPFTQFPHHQKYSINSRCARCRLAKSTFPLHVHRSRSR